MRKRPMTTNDTTAEMHVHPLPLGILIEDQHSYDYAVENLGLALTTLILQECSGVDNRDEKLKISARLIQNSQFEYNESITQRPNW
jgi:hypothetical protein